jgi:organic radical activating enzyme
MTAGRCLGRMPCMRARHSLGDARLWNSFCEIQVAEHCNLTCRSCSHISPAMKKTLVETENVLRDLSLLARSYHTGGVKLIGGEPLLHPDLPAVAKAVRASGVTNRVYVVTNGILLPKMGADFWRAIDEVWISVYPASELSSGAGAQVRARAKEHGVRLLFLATPRFRESFATQGTKERALVKRIYATCKVAHHWCCHTVVNGYFYKCPQAYFITKVLGSGNGPLGAGYGINGIEISGAPTFRDELREYLGSPDPLDACTRCLGTVGRRFEHEQIGRRGWLQRQDRRTEDLVDLTFLAVEEQRMRLPKIMQSVAARLVERLSGCFVAEI